MNDNQRQANRLMNNSFPPHDDDKIIRIPTLAERDKTRREKDKQQKKLNKQNKEPFINMPPHSLAATLAILIIHAALQLLPALINIPIDDLALQYLSFTPGNWTGESAFSVISLITPLSYAVLHGDWFHVLINALMLAALGTGIERRFGATSLWILLIGGNLFAVLAHFLVDPQSTIPLVGISGGTSALFAGIMILFIRMKNTMPQQSRFGNVTLTMKDDNSEKSANHEIAKIILIFIAISIVFALLSGGTSAWAAHIGGLLGGVFIALKILRM